MIRVSTGATDQTILFYAYDANGNGLEICPETRGLEISYRIDQHGRQGTPVPVPVTCRHVPGVHRDGALTHRHKDTHEFDLPDAAFLIDNSIVSLEVIAEPLKGGYLMVRTIEVTRLVDVDELLRSMVTSGSIQHGQTDHAGVGSAVISALSLDVDNENRTIRRSAPPFNMVHNVIDWSKHHEKWEAFKRICEAFPRRLTSNVLSISRQTKSKMNEDLSNLGLRISPGPYWGLEIIPQNSEEIDGT